MLHLLLNVHNAMVNWQHVRVTPARLTINTNRLLFSNSAMGSLVSPKIATEKNTKNLAAAGCHRYNITYLLVATFKFNCKQCYHRWVFPTKSGFFGSRLGFWVFFWKIWVFFIRGHNFVFPIIISLTTVINSTWKLVINIYVLHY